MGKCGRLTLLLAGLALAGCILAGAERRGDVKGSAAYPVVRPDGGLTLIYLSPDRDLGLRIESGIAGLLSKNAILASAPISSAPVAKKDSRGEIGIVWTQSGPEGSSIRHGFLMEDSIAPILEISRETDAFSAPDLDFDAASDAWIAWVGRKNGRALVFVAETAGGRTWVINGRLTASALQPRVPATPAQGIWVFWTGRDRGRDEICASRYRAGSWSEPMSLNKDDAVPHLGVSAALDAHGFPWAVWSEYDGRAYKIFSASWDGTSWSAPAKLSEGEGSDMSPAAACISGSVPLVVWSRAEMGTTALIARFRQSIAWSPEIRITGVAEKTARSPRISVSGDTIGIAWDAGENARSLVLSLRELAAKTSETTGLAVPVLPQAPPSATTGLSATTGSPIFDPARDENQYTGFGDSITYAENHGYLPRLEPMLRQRYGAATIWNEGIGGETTADGLARFDQALAAHASRFLMLMEGTNDVIFGDISMDTTAFDLGEMARRALNAGVLPIISTIIPRKDWYWFVPVFQNRIFDLNIKIRAIAAARKIPLVDQFNFFYYYPSADGGWQSLILDDGVHPNPKGFDVMASAWFDGIRILPFAPARLRLMKESDKVMFAERVYEVLRWQNSPKCEADQIVAFRIYRKERAESAQAFTLRTVFPFLASAADYRFLDGQIVPGRAYAYVVTALRKDGVEGPASNVIFDIP
jgi:lysophospholipase L1-like esterase